MLYIMHVKQCIKMNIKGKYILKPYVQKRFQTQCSESTLIDEKILLPSDISKRM